MYVGCQGELIRHKLQRQRREKIEQCPSLQEVMPFCLDITPAEPLKVPSKGFLEAKITNNTAKPHTLDITFDSFFFNLNHTFQLRKHWRGYSNSADCGYDHLDPKQSITLKIGFSNKIPSKDRINYKHTRPEGFLRILHFEDEKWPMREPIVPPGRITETRVFELELEKEPKKYKELKEQYEKIKKDQERRARWGQELEIRDGLVFKVCKTLEGEVVESVAPDEQVKAWQVLDIPDDLEKIDGMTDEEVAKWRKERMEKIQIIFEKLGVYWMKRNSPITDILKDMEKQVAEKEIIVENGKKANLIFEKSKESKVKKVEKSKVEKPKSETGPPKK